MKFDSSIPLHTDFRRHYRKYLHNNHIKEILLQRTQKLLTIKENIKTFLGGKGTIKRVKCEDRKEIFGLIVSDNGLIARV